MPATHGLIGPLFEAAEAMVRLSHPHQPTQGPVSKAFNTLLFAAQTQNVPALRVLHAALGRHMRVFSGDTATSFAEVSEIMAREPEKIEWLAGPLADRADYLTKGYLPFVLAGPNHRLRREHVLQGIARAYAQVPDLDPLLDAGPDPEHAIVRFLFRHLCACELSADEVTWFLEFKRQAQPLVLLPKLLRLTLLRERHEAAQGKRLYFLERIERAGQPIADTWFDVLWFNSGTLSFYPDKALKLLERRPDLRRQVEAEAQKPMDQRHRTRALIHETLRIYGKIASTNYLEDGNVRVALLPTAAVDRRRYDNPYEVDLSRDHSDTLAFSGPATTRKCPAERFAPDLMASVVAHSLRTSGFTAPTSKTQQ